MGAPHEEFERYNAGAGLMPRRSLGAAAVPEENNMLKEFIEKIVSLAEPTIIKEEDGRVYSNQRLREVQPPLVQPICVQTLTGFRDLYMEHDHDEFPSIIHIQDHTSVWLMAKKVDEWQRRAAFVHAQLPSDSPRFRFGTWLDPEEFVIGLMTLFEDGDYAHGDHRKVVKLVNSLASEAVTISNDDGFSQQVVTKQGMVTKNEEKVSPRVSLSPYRTFREVSQPASDFILRLRSRQGQMPSCALFEADGNAWRNDAVKNIKEYFAKELPNASVVA